MMKNKSYTTAICEMILALDRDILTASNDSLRAEENGNDQIVNW